jgi:uncharacterized protein YjiS (DUF1127 family)
MTIDFAHLEIFSPGHSEASAPRHEAQRLPLAARVFAALGGGMAALARKIAERAERRAVLDELSRLSDRELADIGLTRGDLMLVFDPGFAAQREAARTARCLALRAA